MRFVNLPKRTLSGVLYDIGGKANIHGFSTEEYFFNSLDEDKRLGKFKFDEISKNLPYKLPNLEVELLLMSITFIS